jgi:GTP-binding protein HflX
VHLDIDQPCPGALEEFKELAVSAGVRAVALIRGVRKIPDAKYFIGSGKVDEIAEQVRLYSPEVVIFNHGLTPGQERNIEHAVGCRVLDRTGLILDIFAQRARTFEGKLQVELAQLRYLSTRLIRGWTHLERQKGGIGLRGPGETQLETDRRLIRQRIKVIDARLAKVRLRRKQSQKARQRADMSTVALVGYTNAGKSTLFNHLTLANVDAADRLFATLDPTLRQIKIPRLGQVVLADTVGFIRQLPHDLVAAFHATLEEVRQADLLLHIVDASHPDRRDYIADVESVLKEIGADKVPKLLVYNKIDLLDDAEPHIDKDHPSHPWRVWMSAVDGRGEDLLKACMGELLGGAMITRVIRLSPKQGKLRAKLYALESVVQAENDETGGWLMTVHLPVSLMAEVSSFVVD